MIRLPLGAHSALWAEFLQLLLHDLEPLGFSVTDDGDCLVVNVSVPTEVDRARAFWDDAHQRQHAGLLTEQATAIGEFEANHPDVFVRTDLFCRRFLKSRPPRVPQC
ncbi:hypothetical protein [Mycolicibacterium alvei]|uniref:Uncharacterized protein n=1 Tax=Mycolicibacterium alvei TaxID=67081 RepID=A0A6N4UX27_9MYCO|nr:hypothetical protein [Mycolicibacterium alvei]MCV7004115.1 hypothetical protein [Mycolicibacterium alvei]BBX28495.1 hypothetical protein MALV_36200 [Mycolicibacterium alvei]